MIETLTALLVLITGFYAWVTFKTHKANEEILSEMRRQQEAFYRPYVSISPVVFSDNPCFFLKIKNSGKTTAHNLKLTIDKNFYQFGRQSPENNLRILGAFTETIDSFVPGAELLFYLAQGFVVFGKDSDENITPHKFSIYAEYEYMNRKFVEKTIIDLYPYSESAIPKDSVVDKLKLLTDTIDNRLSNLAPNSDI